MEQLRENIKSKRNIKENTLNIYIKNINYLSKQITKKEFKNDNFLRDFVEVKKYLETKSLSTRKNYLATILVVLRLGDGGESKELIGKYTAYLNKVSDKYYNGIKEQKKSDKQSENWVGLGKLRKVVNHYAKLVRQHNINLKGKNILDRKEKEILKGYLVSALYLLPDNPPRRNGYANMKVVSASQFNKLTDKDKQDTNYLVIQSRNRKKFYFSRIKRNEPQIILVGSKLNSVLNLYLKYHKDGGAVSGERREWLLYNSRGTKMSSNGLTKFLNKVFNITGKKNISSTMIRHIFISDTFDLPKLSEQQKTAKKMGHSVKTQVETYYKHDE